jgi:hypothetical protein
VGEWHLCKHAVIDRFLYRAGYAARNRPCFACFFSFGVLLDVENPIDKAFRKKQLSLSLIMIHTINAAIFI